MTMQHDNEWIEKRLGEVCMDEHASIYMREYHEHMMRWIPVSESLPKQGENVLLWHGEKDGEIPPYFIGSLEEIYDSSIDPNSLIQTWRDSRNPCHAGENIKKSLVTHWQKINNIKAETINERMQNM